MKTLPCLVSHCGGVLYEFSTNTGGFLYGVVFKRVNGQPFVLDSASYLPSNIRQDFDAIQPKWFIKVSSA